jgi:hypothetical protein
MMAILEKLGPAARPPMFEEIAATFSLARKQNVVFAWGDTIYNPGGGRLSPEIHVHEAVHGKRQGADVEGWWRRYIAEPAFRLEEEIPAHIAQYRAFCVNHTKGNARNQRRLYLHHVAKCLASPLYGSLIRYDDARKLIKEAVSAPA